MVYFIYLMTLIGRFYYSVFKFAIFVFQGKESPIFVWWCVTTIPNYTLWINSSRNIITDLLVLGYWRNQISGCNNVKRDFFIQLLQLLPLPFIVKSPAKDILKKLKNSKILILNNDGKKELWPYLSLILSMNS